MGALGIIWQLPSVKGKMKASQGEPFKATLRQRREKVPYGIPRDMQPRNPWIFQKRKNRQPGDPKGFQKGKTSNPRDPQGPHKGFPYGSPVE